MKIKIFFLAAVFLYLNTSIAQNQTINNVAIGLDAPAWGTSIKMNIPSYTVGWTRGYSISNNTGSENFITLGSFGSASNGVFSVTNSFIGKDHTNQYMTFLPSGFIGIGTTTPVAKLDVNGEAKINGNLNIINGANKIVGFGDSANYYLGHFPVTGSSGLDIHWFGGIRFGDATSNSVMQISNDNVGIGTTTPNAKLDVNGTVAATTFSGSGALLTGTATGLSIGGTSASTESLKYNDGPRNLTDRLPNTFTRSVRYDFVAASTIASSGNYAGVMTYNIWDGTTASTGDSSYQLAYVNESGINGAGIPGLKLRKGIDTA